MAQFFGSQRASGSGMCGNVRQRRADSGASNPTLPRNRRQCDATRSNYIGGRGNYWSGWKRRHGGSSGMWITRLPRVPAPSWPPWPPWFVPSSIPFRPWIPAAWVVLLAPPVLPPPISPSLWARGTSLSTIPSRFRFRTPLPRSRVRSFDPLLVLGHREERVLRRRGGR